MIRFSTILIYLILVFNTNHSVLAKNGHVSPLDQTLKNIQFVQAPLQDIDIKVSPNPANDVFSVASNIYFSKIQLYNIIGKSMKTFYPAVDNTYEIGDLPSGVYILRFLDGQDKLIKIVKLYKRG